MRRCVIVELGALGDFEERIDARPDLGFVVATADATASDGSVAVEIGEVGCCPLGLVTIARALLTTAGDMLDAAPLHRERTAGLAAYIAAAQAVLADPFAFEPRP